MAHRSEDTALLGSQQPTSKTVAEYEYSYGDVAIECAEMAGLVLDPYQRDVLTEGLGVVRRRSNLIGAPEEEQEFWSAREVGLELSRQNGKSAIFEARVLAGLYVFRERLIVYSAHKGETAMGAFARIEGLIKNDPELLAEVKLNGFRRTNGKEAIELITGQTVKFRTRTAGGGRGLSGDCVILDEAQDLNDDHLAALLPVVSAMPNAQLWYGGSAGGKHSVVQGRLVRRCERMAAGLTYFRWSAPDDSARDDPKVWARVNPAVGRRMTIESISAEYDAMSSEKFDRERLGIGDYPRAEGEDWVIPRGRWELGLDKGSEAIGKVVFSIEVKWDRAASSICVAGHHPREGHRHIEVIANEPGVMWTADRMVQLSRKHPNLGVVIDPASPANTLVGPLRDHGIDVHLLTTDDLTQAFGDMYDGFVTVEEPTYHHRGGTALTSAVAEVQAKNVRGSTTLRRVTAADVTSILGCCWAAHGLKILEDEPEPVTSPISGAERVHTGAGAGITADVGSIGF